jgi:hypothetical protein
LGRPDTSAEVTFH